MESEIKEYPAEDFKGAIESFKDEFGLDDSFDFKKDPYHIIAFYQAISVRKIENTMQSLVDEIKTLNSKLVDIKSQISTNATKIADAIDDLH